MEKSIYSSHKKWGLIFFISILFILLLIYLVVDRYSARHSTVIVHDITEEWLTSSPRHADAPLPQHFSPERNTDQSGLNSTGPAAIPYNPSPFDPNTASAELMLANGLPQQTVRRIIAYRNKGGTFYEKEKLLNFGIDRETYNNISPYITISTRRPAYPARPYDRPYKNTSAYPVKTDPTDLDINEATGEDLMQFRGIGPGYSKRIIDYRDKLGGFISVEQLREVYGLPDTVYQYIRDRLVIRPGSIKKININTAAPEELARHPYIRKYMAENIIKFRNDIGTFRSIEELREIPLINEEKYRKIVPYITL